MLLSLAAVLRPFLAGSAPCLGPHSRHSFPFLQTVHEAVQQGQTRCADVPAVTFCKVLLCFVHKRRVLFDTCFFFSW